MTLGVHTAEQIQAGAQHAQQALSARGIVPGDRICISALNSPELLSVILGCLQSGIAPAVLSSSATERERIEMSADIQARLILGPDDINMLAQTSSTTAPTNADTTVLPLPMCRPIHFTSGTSGRPKAVWSGWLPPEQASAWIDEECSAWNITADDLHLVCGPLSHSAPLRFALMTVFAGGSVVIPPKFTAESTASALTELGITSVFMAPTHLQRIMGMNADVQHNLRLLAHAGAACPDSVRPWAHHTFGTDVVVEFYGSTEGQFTMCPGSEWIDHRGSVGRARKGRAMRVDAEGRLWCQAPAHARFEYWGDPVKTADTWQSDGWFTVNDYGYIDEDGYVFLEGRMGDLIISGGVNVYPAEIERVLMEMPGIEHVVAFGLPDHDWGQRVCIAVVGSVSEQAITAYLSTTLSGPKRPKSIYPVDILPMTHSGKVNRAAVPSLFTTNP